MNWLPLIHPKIQHTKTLNKFPKLNRKCRCSRIVHKLGNRINNEQEDVWLTRLTRRRDTTLIHSKRLQLKGNKNIEKWQNNDSFFLLQQTCTQAIYWAYSHTQSNSTLCFFTCISKYRHFFYFHVLEILRKPSSHVRSTNNEEE